MRKISLILFFNLLAISTFAQTNTFPTTGNVGIGTTSPSALLHVNGDAILGNPANNTYSKIVIQGPNLPVTSESKRDISFEFQSASSAVIRSYRGSTWDTYLQFLTSKLDAGSNSPSVRMHINHDGNVGIGTTTPSEKLTIAGDIVASNRLFFHSNGGFSVTNTNVPTLNAPSFSMPHYGIASSPTVGSADVWIASHTAVRMFNGGNPVPAFNLVGGNLGLGTQTIPAGYKLAVKGNLIAEKIVVKNSTNWPDFVFKKDYKLPSLNEVEQFISKNSHLPEIPSAREVESKGQDVGEMNRLLLKKVEEITLYLIELKKENQEMKKEIEDLRGKK